VIRNPQKTETTARHQNLTSSFLRRDRFFRKISSKSVNNFVELSSRQTDKPTSGRTLSHDILLRRGHGTDATQ